MLTTARVAHHQLEEGYNIGLLQQIPKGAYTHIIFCGMGGSALVADMMRDYVRENITIDVVKDYFIPVGLLRENTLVMLCSYSGNTEETISCFHQAIDMKLPTLILAHGGTLEELATENNVPFYKVPKIEETRCALGFSFGIIIAIFEQMGVALCNRNILRDTMEFVENHVVEIEAEGKKLAHELEKKVPVFYASASKGSLARLMKIHCNENAKIQSYYGEIPEINHNEMVGYTHLLMTPALVFMRSQFDFSKVQLRMDIMKELCEEKGIACVNLKLKGNSWLDEVYYALMLAYFSTYYLAESYSEPYGELAMVHEFKKRLAA